MSSSDVAIRCTVTKCVHNSKGFCTSWKAKNDIYYRADDNAKCKYENTK